MGKDQRAQSVNSGGIAEKPARSRPKKRVITAARKEQNRLAQKAFRQRQKELKKAAQTSSSSVPALAPRSDEREGTQPVRPSTCAEDAGPKVSDLRPCRMSNTLTINPKRLNDPDYPSMDDIDGAIKNDSFVDDLWSTFISPETAPENSSLSQQMLAIQSLDESAPIPPGLLAMSLRLNSALEDNRTNVFRACLTNAICIGIDISQLMHCQRPYQSPFYNPRASPQDDPDALIAAATTHADLPESLKPTLSQVLIPHHASIDLIPIPKLRDRAIMMCAALPQMFSLWDMKLDIYARDAIECRRRETPDGPVAQPWDERSWKASPWFMTKWKMVVDYDMIHVVHNHGIPGLWM
ncbi:hypothetical protein F5Y16DRAFT_345525 [Xylariaceae sp. FL0255]|nr:hypothetical protein F5Y16DRAFT_345525 [Xylariaceae sp. FL0255]